MRRARMLFGMLLIVFQVIGLVLFPAASATGDASDRVPPGAVVTHGPDCTGVADDVDDGAPAKSLWCDSCTVCIFGAAIMGGDGLVLAGRTLLSNDIDRPRRLVGLDLPPAVPPPLL